MDTFENAVSLEKVANVTKPTSTCTSEDFETKPSFSPYTSTPGVQYEDCVVNIYQTPTMMPPPTAPQYVHYFHYPDPPYYPPSYPDYSHPCKPY